MLATAVQLKLGAMATFRASDPLKVLNGGLCLFSSHVPGISPLLFSNWKQRWTAFVLAPHRVRSNQVCYDFGAMEEEESPRRLSSDWMASACRLLNHSASQHYSHLCLVLFGSHWLFCSVWKYVITLTGSIFCPKKKFCHCWAVNLHSL